jgi:predicted  nucleic acid-binding Zn-ribbon protein
LVLTAKNNDADIATAQSYTTVIEQLRSEVDRLHSSNKTLFESLQTMMDENQKLSGLVAELRADKTELEQRMQSLEAVIEGLRG